MPQSEAELPRAESGVGFLARGSKPPPHQLGVWGRFGLPSGVRAEPRPPTGLPPFSAPSMSSPGTVDYHAAIGGGGKTPVTPCYAREIYMVTHLIPREWASAFPKKNSGLTTCARTV